MKINELVGAKSHPAFKAAQEIGTNPNPGFNAYSQDEGKSLTTRLGELGWTLAGSGHYALVFQHPAKNYVLKVFSAENTLWIKYFNYVRQHQNNPHVPRVQGGLVKLSPTAYAVRMEKLTPLAGYHDPILRRYIDPRHLTRQSDIMDIFSEENDEYLNAEHPDLADLMNDIWNIARANGDYDLHDENIMKRGNTLVITDPV